MGESMLSGLPVIALPTMYLPVSASSHTAEASKVISPLASTVGPTRVSWTTAARLPLYLAKSPSAQGLSGVIGDVGMSSVSGSSFS